MWIYKAHNVSKQAESEAPKYSAAASKANKIIGMIKHSFSDTS